MVSLRLDPRAGLQIGHPVQQVDDQSVVSAGDLGELLHVAAYSSQASSCETFLVTALDASPARAATSLVTAVACLTRSSCPTFDSADRALSASDLLLWSSLSATALAPRLIWIISGALPGTPPSPRAAVTAFQRISPGIYGLISHGRSAIWP